jgi:hypothetical protein
LARRDIVNELHQTLGTHMAAAGVGLASAFPCPTGTSVRQQPPDGPSQGRVPLDRTAAVSHRTVWRVVHRIVENIGALHAPGGQSSAPQHGQVAPFVPIHPSWPCAIAS